MDYEFLLLALEVVFLGFIFIGVIVNLLFKHNGISRDEPSDEPGYGQDILRPHDTYTNPILADSGPNIFSHPDHKA